MFSNDILSPSTINKVRNLTIVSKNRTENVIYTKK